KMYRPAPAFFTDEMDKEALQLYQTFCPGIIEELKGFSEESNIPMREMSYEWMTYLVPGCCGICLPGSRMSDGHTRILRSYEFGIEEEDLTVCRTSIPGKYTHIGTTIATFGRGEGINEHGLAVAQSSCGFPVSNLPQMRRPAIKGLQFWAVIRTLLENCKSVDEALEMLKDMPIAYNINLYLADSSGMTALYETMNGAAAFEKSPGDKKDCLFGTNHIVIKSFQNREPAAMRNSVLRYERIREFLQETGTKTEEECRAFLLKKYPKGPSACYYDEWFGTIRSAVLDTKEKRFSICWFGREENGWEDYFADQELQVCEKEKTLVREKAERGFFEVIPLI
ncbi:MAG TPA: C45 family autoproteolytic acyltransferase/hydrolase, partial [Lachnospiraceae bacterium]|nr:C45 family autoproteolytic acyltransferase/hydrolase [Lachnospiraceae bacterium]